jgi:hypothetical protein
VTANLFATHRNELRRQGPGQQRTADGDRGRAIRAARTCRRARGDRRLRRSGEERAYEQGANH